MTNCTLGAQSCLQRLKCFQISTWFRKLWGSPWDPASGFLGMLLKPAWGSGPSRTGSADGLPVCDGVKCLQVPGVQGGVCLAVGWLCDYEGVLSAGEVSRGAEFIQSPVMILGAAQYSRRLSRALWEFRVVPDAVLCVDLCYSSS